MASGSRIQEAIGLRGAYVLGTAIYVGVFVVLSTLSSPVALTFVVAISGIALALVYVGAVVIVDVLVPPSLRATGQGLRQAAVFGVGPILGTVGGGSCSLTSGPRPCSWARRAPWPPAPRVVRAHRTRVRARPT